MVAGKAQAQNNNGQASPAPLNQDSEVQSVNSGDNLSSPVGILPFQQHSNESEKWQARNLHAGDSFHVYRGSIPSDVGNSVNEQNIPSSVRPISGDFDPAAANSSDRKNEVKNDQNTNANPDPDGNSCDSRPGHNLGSYNRADDEVKNDQALEGLAGSNSDNRGNNYLGQLSQINNSDSSDCFGLEAPSARLSAPANQASFDAGKLNPSHVQNDQEKQETATCANPPELEPKQDTLTGRQLTAWAIENYAVDPIQNSKNRWRIRLRCRKTGCKHEGHLGLKTVSFMSDSAFKKLTKSGRKYELWKKAIKAENAGTLRKSERSRPSADCASGDQGIS